MIISPPELDMPPSVTPVEVDPCCGNGTGEVQKRYISNAIANWATFDVYGFGKQHFSSVPIRSLDSPSVTIIHAIPAQIEIEDGVFVATFAEANVSASGETEDEAIEMLKDMIAWTYQFLSQKESVLGQWPQRQLAVLRRFLQG